MACDRSTALRVAMDAVSASSDMFSSNVPPRRHVYDGTMNLEQLHQETLLEDLDKIVLGDRESGNRILHRHKQAEGRMDYSVIQDSGLLSTNQYAENYKKMSESGIDLLQKSLTFCYECGHALIVSTKDTHIKNAVIVYCSNNECRHNQKRNEKRIGRYHPIDLSEVYLFLANDAGYIGYQHHIWADAFIARCKTSFYNHARMNFFHHEYIL